jgi:transposase InsO family protein
MPWKTSSIVVERERFALAALRQHCAFARLCVQFGISRKTGYKWLTRYRAGGATALGDVSRRPRRCARQKPAGWKAAVQRIRRARPYWGAKKIRARLRALHPHRRLPAVRTIARWLQELGLLGRPSRRARRGPVVPHPGLTTPRRLHQLWTLDFKGWFRTTDGQRHEPLTVREAWSRFLLEIRLLPKQSDQAARRVLARLFRAHGLPAAIRVDNGAPFGGRGALGLSRLSVWWLRLGIQVEFTRRARPGDNAAHEQMHRRYKAEVLARPAAHRQAQQRRSDRWRHEYNHRRPHEALGQQPTARHYRTSPRPAPASLPTLRYPATLATRRVRSHGDIKWHGRLRFIGRAFVGQTVGLKTLNPSSWAVHLGSLLIGHLHAADPAGMRPARWHHLPDSPLKL